MSSETWMVGAVVLGSGIAIWRTVGWIRMERPMSEHRKDIFTSTGPRYRRTQPADARKLQILRVRAVRRRA